MTFYHDVEQDSDSRADPAACRRFVDALVAMEKNHGISATYNVVGRLWDEQPDMIASIEGGGHEAAFHSYHHYDDWNPAYFADEVRRCREVSDRPTGYRSPRSQWNKSTMDALWKHGFLWSAENDPYRDEPYFVHKGLVRLPILTDEWPIVRGRYGHDRWVQIFESAIQKKRYLAVGLHDYTAVDAPDKWLRTWELLLSSARDAGALMLTFSQAADLYRRGAVAKHYDETAEHWNRHSATLYRTKRFRELLLQQATQLSNPVVADLASAGGVQGVPLARAAKKVYCIDNSPGMVATVVESARVVPKLGEMTATGLPGDSMDLVFCVNAIEYLYQPDQLADEIKRIAKPGARCLVAFPSQGGCPTRPPVTAPDRIQRHFSRDEVLRWAELIGPGTVFGIQYDPSEPATVADETRYRAEEERPPEGRLPMFWVFVGRVIRKDRTCHGFLTVPIASAPFTYKHQTFDPKLMIHRARKRIPQPLKRAVRLVRDRKTSL